LSGVVSNVGFFSGLRVYHSSISGYMWS